LLYGDLFVPRPAHLLPLLKGASRDTATLRVMSFNLLLTNRDVAGLTETIAAADPDVLLVQELNSRAASALNALLADSHPYQQLRVTGLGQGMWSRYPIVAEEHWPGSQRDAQWQHAILAVDNRPVHLVNLHLTSPRINRQRLPELPVPLVTGQVAEARRQETVWLVPRLRAIISTGEPVIVAGDLNMTDQATEYSRLLSAGLSDAYRQAGWGFGHTFPARRWIGLPGRQLEVAFPVVRIDHVLVSSRVKARAIRVWDAGSSDHHPVVADLAV
jgi:endonuclease/exonuclease/phosphatase family metal-dependent hydrolase